jgi:hypothetical protein
VPPRSSGRYIVNPPQRPPLFIWSRTRYPARFQHKLVAVLPPKYLDKILGSVDTSFPVQNKRITTFYKLHIKLSLPFPHHIYFIALLFILLYIISILLTFTSYAWQPLGGVGDTRQGNYFVGCLRRTMRAFLTVLQEFDINPEFSREENLLLIQHSTLGVPTNWHLCLVLSAISYPPCKLFGGTRPSVAIDQRHHTRKSGYHLRYMGLTCNLYGVRSFSRDGP